MHPFPVRLGTSHSDWHTFSVEVLSSTSYFSKGLFEARTSSEVRAEILKYRPHMADHTLLTDGQGSVRVNHGDWIVLTRLVPGGEKRRGVLVWDGWKDQLLPVGEALDLRRARRRYEERLRLMDEAELALHLKAQGVL